MKLEYHILALLFAAGIVTSCEDARYGSNEYGDIGDVNTDSYWALVNKYDSIKAYENQTTNPNFRLGDGIMAWSYLNNPLVANLVNKNFDEITMGYCMKHGAVVKSTGNLDFSTIDRTIAKLKEHGLGLYGHTLVWHSNQNATYLNSLIAPEIIGESSGPTLEANLITNSTFDAGDIPAAWGTMGNGTTMTLTDAGQGSGGKGKALCVENPEKRANSYNSQLYYRFDPETDWLKKGDEYKFTMDVRADIATSFDTQIHGAIGAYKGGFLPSNVNVTTEWKTVTFDVTLGNNTGGIVFDLGSVATKYYFDNVSMRRVNPNGDAQVIEKTDAEKKELIEGAMTKFISEMVTHCKDYVHAWDVVNEPMDDGSPHNLKSGVGKKQGSDEFYWQDYMGKDYAVTAFKLARQYGNADDKLFINDYNLECTYGGDMEKLRGLIEYVNYIESKGAKVDGIGTQMHIDTDRDTAAIVKMFKYMAATGKLIRVSELDVGMGNGTTFEDYQKQADMYKFVIENYFKYVPAAQRYGITIWGLNDVDPNKDATSKQTGLWDCNYQRKLSYKAFCDALAGKEVFNYVSK